MVGVGVLVGVLVGVAVDVDVGVGDGVDVLVGLGVVALTVGLLVVELAKGEVGLANITTKPIIIRIAMIADRRDKVNMS
jgi:hypothetical protein